MTEYVTYMLKAFIISLKNCKSRYGDIKLSELIQIEEAKINAIK